MHVKKRGEAEGGRAIWGAALRSYRGNVGDVGKLIEKDEKFLQLTVAHVIKPSVNGDRIVWVKGITVK
jgi:hypothetical protein